MVIKRAFAVVLPFVMVVSTMLSTTESKAEAVSSEVASTCAQGSSDPETSGISRRDPPELSGCNSRCRRVYCAESGSNRTYLCRCDCSK